MRDQRADELVGRSWVTLRQLGELPEVERQALSERERGRALAVALRVSSERERAPLAPQRGHVSSHTRVT